MTGVRSLPAYAATAFHWVTQAMWLPGIPILTYHSIDDEGGPESIRMDCFSAQMEYLKENGFRSIPLSELRNLTTEDRSSDRLFCVTFDDGYQNLLASGVPLLCEHGFQATVFAVSDGWGEFAGWKRQRSSAGHRLMTEQELCEVSRAGVEIGAHTCSHPFLTRIQLESVRREIRASKDKLEQILGKRVHHFAYPYGAWDQRIRDLCAEAGFEMAFTTEQRKARRNEDPWVVPRVGVNRMPVGNRRLALNSLRACLSGTVGYYVTLRRLVRLNCTKR